MQERTRDDGGKYRDKRSAEAEMVPGLRERENSKSEGKMKTVSKMGAQGDVVFIRVKCLPQTAVEAKRPAGAPIVVAHSETQHHHVVLSPEARFYSEPGDPMLCYLQLGDGDCDIVHQRTYDTHETLRLLGGAGAVYEVRRQREWTPEGWRRVED